MPALFTDPTVLKEYAAVALLALAASAARAQAPANLPVVSTPDQLGQAGGVRYYDQNWLPLTGPAGAYGYDVYRRLNDSLGLQWQRRRYVVASGRHGSGSSSTAVTWYSCCR